MDLVVSVLAAVLDLEVLVPESALGVSAPVELDQALDPVVSDPVLDLEDPFSEVVLQVPDQVPLEFPALAVLEVAASVTLTTTVLLDQLVHLVHLVKQALMAFQEKTESTDKTQRTRDRNPHQLPVSPAQQDRWDPTDQRELQDHGECAVLVDSQASLDGMDSQELLVPWDLQVHQDPKDALVLGDQTVNQEPSKSDSQDLLDHVALLEHQETLARRDATKDQEPSDPRDLRDSQEVAGQLGAQAVQDRRDLKALLAAMRNTAPAQAEAVHHQLARVQLDLASVLALVQSALVWVQAHTTTKNKKRNAKCAQKFYLSSSLPLLLSFLRSTPRCC